MPLKQRGAGKRELHEPVSLHSFPSVFVFRCGDLSRVRFPGTPPTEGPDQVHPVVLPVIPCGRYRHCLGNVSFLEVERSRNGRQTHSTVGQTPRKRKYKHGLDRVGIVRNGRLRFGQSQVLFCLAAFAVDTAITPGVVSTLFWSFPPTLCICLAKSDIERTLCQKRQQSIISK